MPRKGGRRKAKKPSMASMPDASDVDAFHDGKDKVLLASMRRDAGDSDDGGASSQDEAVMDLNAYQESSDDDDSDSDDSSDGVAQSKAANGAAAGGSDDSDGASDDDSDDPDKKAVKMANAKGTAGWGTKRAEFFGGDTGDVSDLDEEDARDEEKEAMRLQRARAELLQDDDFDLDVTMGDAADGAATGEAQPTSSKKSKSAKKRKRRKSRSASGDDSAALAGANAGLNSVASRLDGAVTVERVAKDVSGLSEDEKLQIVISDSPELLGLLEEFKRYINEINDQIRPVLDRIKQQALPTSRGVTFLQVKLHLLLCYVTNLAFYLLLKAEGRSVKDHPVLDQILRTRTMLDRLKPLDSKLQYQIARLLRSGEADEDQSRPNLGALLPHGSAGADGDAGAEEDGSGDVYQPLKRTAVAFETKSSKEERRTERMRRRASRSKVLAELKEELSEAPMQIRARSSASAAVDKREEEQRRFEEENMVRLVVSKKERKLRRQQRREASRLDTLADLEDFGDLEELLADEEAAGAGRGGALRGSAKKRALQAAVNQAEQRHRTAVSRAMATSGDQDVTRRERQAKRTFADDAEAETHFGRGGKGGAEAEAGGMSDDETYTAAVRQKAAKRARKQKARDETMAARKAAAAASVLPEEDVGEGFDGKRKVNRAIMKNRGLMKYRKREDANPRVHMRKKFLKKQKARRGQVTAMREHEGAVYGGEASGIRTRLARSHKL